MTILIVDDEPKLLALFKTHFEYQGHTVYGTESGEDALVLLQQHQPQVAFVDLWLKGDLTGKDVLRDAKRLLPAIRVVIVSGDEETPPETLLQLGAAAFLKKPIQLEELDHLLEQIQKGS
jgi:DNA-binding NtrC family response regulator